MISKESFYKDKENCQIPFTHILDIIHDPQLKQIDELYGAADVLSIENSKKYHNILLILAVVGTLTTLTFLIYDEIDFHGIIFICGFLILYMIFIHKQTNKMEYHEKYIEYRVLAETLRVQFFLKMAGIKEDAINLMPWSIKEGLPWISDILSSLPKKDNENCQSILDCWVNDQKAYHESALTRTIKKNRQNEHITKIIFSITILIYIIVILSELLVYLNMFGNFDFYRYSLILKVLMGVMSAMSLFTDNYYGKMSLSNKIDDHKRMIKLYETVERNILKNGETEEELILLAREFLNENSTWYAYQSKNKAGII